MKLTKAPNSNRLFTQTKKKALAISRPYIKSQSYAKGAISLYKSKIIDKAYSVLKVSFTPLAGCTKLSDSA